MHIPTVLSDDLAAFHIKHFGTAPSQTVINPSSSVQPEHDEDSLGYYEDGVKRTLTDEQVAMFRHSEIQELLKERRKVRKKRKRAVEQNGKREVNHEIRVQTRGSAEDTVLQRAPTAKDPSELLYDDASGQESKTSHIGTLLAGRTLKSYNDFDDDDTIRSTKNTEAIKNTKATFQWPSLKA